MALGAPNQQDSVPQTAPGYGLLEGLETNGLSLRLSTCLSYKGYITLKLLFQNNQPW